MKMSLYASFDPSSHVSFLNATSVLQSREWHLHLSPLSLSCKVIGWPFAQILGLCIISRCCKNCMPDALSFTTAERVNKSIFTTPQLQC